VSLIHNERTKLTATLMNTVAAAVFIAGVLAPLRRARLARDGGKLLFGASNFQHGCRNRLIWPVPGLTGARRDLILKMAISIDGFIAHGGASFARSLVAQGLVDQFALIVVPVALGKGLPLFSDPPAPRSLKLVSSKAFPGGAVAQIYRAA
jgi:hypothetical protein